MTGSPRPPTKDRSAAYEQAHGVKRGLLRSGRQFARDLCQTSRRQPAEHQWNAAGGIEETDHRVGGTGLIGIEAAGRRNEIQREIEERIVAVVAQARFEFAGRSLFASR